jgi:integral membrane protein
MSDLGFLRRVALAEAVSYLVLLTVAMPLKYLAGLPLAVRIVGLLHGVLFLVLCWALLQAWLDKLALRRCMAFLALSFVPIVPFFFDRRLRQWATERR